MVFASPGLADEWFEENDPEGVRRCLERFTMGPEHHCKSVAGRPLPFLDVLIVDV